MFMLEIPREIGFGVRFTCFPAEWAAQRKPSETIDMYEPIKRIRSAILAAGLVAGLSLSGTVEAQEQQQQQQQQRLVQVATLNTVAANQEFQRNIRIMQALRDQAVQLQQQVEQAPTSQERAELQSQLDALLERLNNNNQTMIENYGFSLTRNYTLVVEKAYIYMYVSDEEAAAIEAARENGN